MKASTPRASCYWLFEFTNGAPGLALVSGEHFSEGTLICILASGDPATLRTTAALLWHITRWYSGVTVPKVAPAMAIQQPGVYAALPQPPLLPGSTANGPTAAPATPTSFLSFERFTELQIGAFHIDVPRGWQVRGGFQQAGLGDQRISVLGTHPARLRSDLPAGQRHHARRSAALGRKLQKGIRGCGRVQLLLDGQYFRIVVGTETGTPPDYLRDFRPLKRL